MLPVTQSAYRKFYSTESAVMKVINDLLLAADGGQVSALSLLDLTAAFDIFCCSVLSASLVFMVSHCSDFDRTFLRGPSELFSASVLRLWFCSVPQGSVLRSRVFVMYTADLADLVADCQVNFHSFADDSQVYTCTVCSSE